MDKSTCIFSQFQVDPALGPAALGLSRPGPLPAGLVQPCPKPRALIHKQNLKRPEWMSKYFFLEFFCLLLRTSIGQMYLVSTLCANLLVE